MSFFAVMDAHFILKRNLQPIAVEAVCNTLSKGKTRQYFLYASFSRIIDLGTLQLAQIKTSSPVYLASGHDMNLYCILPY